MKRFILMVLIALMATISQAEVVRNGDTFKVEQTAKQDTKTKFTWEDKDGNKYPIFITKKGACYIFKVSKKTGKEYKYYLPKDIQEQIQKEVSK